MSSVIEVPQGLSYLTGAFLSTVFLLMGQSSVVGRYRKKAGVDYPQAYAEKKEADASLDAKKFNCAQRAHQNTLETLPLIYTTTIITAIKYPVAASAALTLWSFSRVLYTRGYVSGDPAQRNKQGGYLQYISAIGLLGGSIYVSASLFLAGI